MRVETIDLIHDEYPHNSRSSAGIKRTLTQWIAGNNGTFSPSAPTVSQVPSGVYEIKFEHSIGLHLAQMPTLEDELFILPSPEITSIIDDMKRFWERKEIYKNYKYVHKRGILLYGEPGCGKSGIIQLCIKHVMEEMDGIVINIKDSGSIEYFDDFVPTLRTIEPQRPLVVLMEDLDAIAGEDKYSTSKLLNILDGIKQIEGVIYIASTNYPEKLEERISNRPSRFDRRYQIAPPSKDIRKSYLEAKLKDHDHNVDIDLWVKESEGMSIAHLKELVVSTLVLGNEFSESIKHLKSLKEKPKGKKTERIGFGSSEKI